MEKPFHCNHERACESNQHAFKCNMCGYEFSHRHHLVDHMRTHTGERPFKCKVSACLMAFKQEAALTTHIKLKHSDERPLKCDFPGFLHTDKTIWTLKLHKNVHSDDRPFPGPHSGCNFRPKRKVDLSRHTAGVNSESKPLTYSKCNYRTNIASHLSRHMMVHEGKNKNIPCSVDGCGYNGKNSKALTDHMRLHKTRLPCPVSGCGQYATTQEALKNHLKLHNPSGRAFQCPLCFKHFATLFKLQRHCGGHTNEKPFPCGHCKYEAATRDHVKIHISLVHKAIEFPFIVHLLEDRECLHCKMTLPSAEFVLHLKGHVEPVFIT